MAKKKLTSAEIDTYYDDMLQQKIKAGLPAEIAREVTQRQRAEDEANKVEISREEAEEESPKAAQTESK